MTEFKYEILEKYGSIPGPRLGTNWELNLISFNDRPAKLDLRQWPEDHERMGKGISFAPEQLADLIELLKQAEK